LINIDKTKPTAITFACIDCAFLYWHCFWFILCSDLCHHAEEWCWLAHC